MNKVTEIYLLEDLEDMLDNFSHKYLSDPGDKRDVTRVVRMIDSIKTELEEESGYYDED